LKKDETKAQTISQEFANIPTAITGFKAEFNAYFKRAEGQLAKEVSDLHNLIGELERQLDSAKGWVSFLLFSHVLFTSVLDGREIHKLTLYFSCSIENCYYSHYRSCCRCFSCWRSCLDCHGCSCANWSGLCHRAYNLNDLSGLVNDVLCQHSSVLPLRLQEA